MLYRLLMVALLLACPPAQGDPLPYPRADPAHEIRFPADEGSHPAFGREWWYVTGWLDTPDGRPLGFQITFFRFRTARHEDNPSRFAPSQVLVGHAALSDPRRGAALHDERIARAGFGLAEAREGATEVWIDDWSLRQAGDGYVAAIRAGGFTLDLRFAPTQPPLLQGERGFSRKAPDPASASHYYSLPQLQVGGTITQGDGREDGPPQAVTGTAWLDHEWFTPVDQEERPAWDWIGMNLSDGGALMAIRMRDAAGRPFWAFGSHRDAAGTLTVFGPGEVTFTPLRSWRSPRTGNVYPVAWRVRAGALEVTVRPLMDDQEFDARASVGGIYWEGAARLFRGDDPIGRGYLEITGHWQPPS